MASQIMRIILKAYDHQLVDSSAKKNYRNCKEERISSEWTGTTSLLRKR